MPGLGEFLFGSSGGIKKKQVYTPGQMNFLNQLLQSLGQKGEGNFLDYYKNILSGQGGEDFESFADPFRKQFEQETVPMLAERFAGLGGTGMGGALSSSGFGQQLSMAGSNLNSQLAQLFAGLRSNAAQQLGGFAGLGLGAQPYALIQKQASPGLVQSGTNAFMSALAGGM